MTSVTDVLLPLAGLSSADMVLCLNIEVCTLVVVVDPDRNNLLLHCNKGVVHCMLYFLALLFK